MAELSKKDTRRRRRSREKVAVRPRRDERACKRIADANLPFHEKGGTTARVIDFFLKRKIGTEQNPSRCGEDNWT